MVMETRQSSRIILIDSHNLHREERTTGSMSGQFAAQTRLGTGNLHVLRLSDFANCVSYTHEIHNPL